MAFMIRKQPPALTPGNYPAHIADVKEVDGQFGPRLVWTVEIAHGGNAYRAQGYTDVTFFQGSQEHRWASAVLGQSLEAGEEIDENELIGGSVTVTISCKPGRDGFKVFYNVVEIRPPASGEGSEPDTDTPDTNAGEEDVPF
jgi:hypothetical protein